MKAELYKEATGVGLTTLDPSAGHHNHQHIHLHSRTCRRGAGVPRAVGGADRSTRAWVPLLQLPLES
jgi:hypothetical protein